METTLNFRIITIGRGKSTHGAFPVSFCGAEGRRGMIDQGTDAEGPVTCKRCIAAMAAQREADHAEALADDLYSKMHCED